MRQKFNPLPTVEQITFFFNYDPDTGDMTWKRPHTHTCSEGVIDAGGGNHGYRVVTLARRIFLQHRLIWKLMTGGDPDPALTIDHINEDPGDNRWCNLRQISRSKNQYRSSKHQRKYVVCAQQKANGRWQATAKLKQTREGVASQEQHHLGMFDSKAEALAADPATRTPAHVPDNKPKVRRTESGRWEARVRIGLGKRKHLGTYDTEAQALAALT